MMLNKRTNKDQTERIKDLKRNFVGKVKLKNPFIIVKYVKKTRMIKLKDKIKLNIIKSNF